MNNTPFPPFISQEELSNLPPIEFSGEITLVESIGNINEALAILSSQKILGFDTETKPSFKKGIVNNVSLLQLATPQKVFLFRLNFLGLPYGLVKILSDRNIMKVGAAIRDDIKILQRLQKFIPKGFIDLQQVVKEFGIENNGVKKLAGIILQGRISKSQQLTNWEAPLISESQKKYAATDAWVCLKMYQKLTELNNE